MTGNRYTEKMVSKTDLELRDIIENNHKYIPEVLEAALAESKKRGTVIEKSETILEERLTKEKERIIESDDWGRHQQVEDESAPLLYSKRAIYTFSLLFSVIFGAVLMVLNLRALKKPDGVIPTISFSVSYLASIILLFNFLESHYNVKVPFGNLVSFLGAWLILELVWNKYIGKEVKYRKRGVMVPLIIGLVITAIYLFILFSAK